MKITAADGFLRGIEFAPSQLPSNEELYEKIEIAKSYYSAVNITEPLVRVAGRAYSSTLQTAIDIKRRFALDVCPYLTCREHNLREMDSYLLECAKNGIQNILILDGDRYPVGSGGHPVEVRETYPSRLIRRVKNELGELSSFRGVNPADYYCLGAVFNVNAPSLTREMAVLERKFGLPTHTRGADYIQTQIVFDVERMHEALEMARQRGIEAPVILEITLLKSCSLIEKLRHLMGIRIPEEYVERISSLEEHEGGNHSGALLESSAIDVLREATRITKEVIQDVKPDGISTSWTSAEAALEVLW